MTLSLAEVQHVAELARLALSDRELETLRDQLSAILDFFARLQDVDADDTASLPAASPLPLVNVLRNDEPRPSLPPSDVLANAPAVQDDCFRVPVVLDLEGRG